jgi:glutaredoxin-related protein
MPKLTRYLYNAEYVKTALTAAIIAQSDFEEVLFWADELYTSGFSQLLSDIIWTCFYTHFAAVNPLMEKYIRRKLAADDPWPVLKNLFHRQQCENLACEPPKRGRKPKWLDDFTDNKHIKNVLLSPSAETVYDYAKHNADMTPLYTTLIAFYASTGVGDVEFFTSHSRQIQQHLILSMMTMMLLTEDEIHTKKIYLTLSDDDNWFLGYIRGDVDTDGRKVPAYCLLNERRLFPEPNGFTGNMLAAKEMLCETPLWRDRFSECDDEKFCEMYDYQPDDYCRRIM